MSFFCSMKLRTEKINRIDKEIERKGEIASKRQTITGMQEKKTCSLSTVQPWWRRKKCDCQPSDIFQTVGATQDQSTRALFRLMTIWRSCTAIKGEDWMQMNFFDRQKCLSAIR